MRLVRLLVRNNKTLCLLSVIASVIGFTFLFTITSLSETIVRTRQDSTVHTYGKFLIVMSDVAKNLEDDVKEHNKQFAYERFGVDGNAEYLGKRITLGSMEEQMGDILGFQLIDGNWPKTFNQVVVEEYVTDLLGIQDEQFPVAVSLTKDGQPVSYEITGIISNYSHALSACCNSTLDTNVYPSIIFQKGQLKNAKTSLVVLQKKLNFKSSYDDIDSFVRECNKANINLTNLSINERLYAKGYNDNADIIKTKRLYLILLNLLLIVELFVIIRVILMRNKKTLFLFEALGLSSKKKRRVVFLLLDLFLILGLVMGYLLTALIGFVYMKKEMLVYRHYYFKDLIWNVLLECVMIGVIMLCFSLGYGRIRKNSIIQGMLEDTAPEKRKYKFKKIDLWVVFMQIICLFFAMASMNFVNMFHFDKNERNYDLYSKRTTVTYPLNGYDIAQYEDNFFNYDSLNEFKEYKDYLNLSMEAETKQCSILFEKDSMDEYFSQYYEEDKAQLSNEDEELWGQVSKEANKYDSIRPDYIKISVLPQKEFQYFMKQNGIENYMLENNEKRACILILPDYKQVSSNPSIEEQGRLELGRIQDQKRKLEFLKESFTVEAILSCDSRENSQIQIVMSESVAKKSKLILGYDKISIAMNSKTPLEVQRKIEQKISLLMASIQGGMRDSSVLRNQEDKLMGGYTSMMSNSILFFCMIAICMYIILNSYIDWEKYKYEYGILRSFGMSYSALQHKLFLRYSNSIIVAIIVAVLMGKNAFPNGQLTLKQIIISFSITIVITYLCRAMVYWWNKNKSISAMINGY